MDRQPVLDGELLRLRPLVEPDWQALFAVACDPLIWEVHPAFDRWQEPVFRAFFEDALAKRGALVVIDRASGAIIGSSRYQNLAEEDGGSVEIGWTFIARSHWGGRHNQDMKRLMLRHAFRFVERVVFMVGETNLRSRRAMEKIGGKLTDYREVRPMAGGEMAYVCYDITRESFAAGPLCG
jgi:N-acetyltransferase